MDIKEYGLHLQASGNSRHPWETAAKVIRFLLKPVLRTWDNKKTVLDIGCGDGYLLGSLYASWPEPFYMGIDTAIDESISRHILEQFPSGRCKIYRHMNQIPADTEKADLLLLLDVLEHTEADESFLGETLLLLKNGGYFLISVPAYPFLFNNHDRWLGHYRRYTSRKLSAMTERAGLKTVRSGYFFSGLVLPRAISKCLGCVVSGKTQNTGISKWEKGNHLGGLLSLLLSWNAFFDILVQNMKIPWFGLSCFILCRK